MVNTLLKEIADLEKKNKVLTQNLEDTEIINKALEKENAELKGLVNQYKASKCSGISMVNRNMIMSDQLTKAKEIIKKLYPFVRDKCYTTTLSENKERQSLIAEAEQFISEVEK